MDDACGSCVDGADGSDGHRTVWKPAFIVRPPTRCSGIRMVVTRQARLVDDFLPDDSRHSGGVSGWNPEDTKWRSSPLPAWPDDGSVVGTIVAEPWHMPRTPADRVAVLESQMQTLQELPGQVAALDARMASLESHFLQLRAEVRSKFLATRTDLRGELRAGDEETRRYMRVLHEELVSRIKTIGEGRG